jgi:TolB-like protein/DNA-binding winged helix-turn-helix (wHTH) protein
MERPSTETLRIGDWTVDPTSGQISRDGQSTRLEVRTMRLLMCLAAHPGEVVSIDDLLSAVWSGINVSPDSVYQAVTALRRQLGDDPKHPAYIETVPRLGYRMVAKVAPWVDNSSPRSVDAVAHGPKSGLARAAGLAFLLCVAIAGALLLRPRIVNNDPSAAALAAQSQKSIAVLPFLDLTEGMKEEEFADGMTEELIDKLSKIDGLRVPAPTASFYFKGKQIPVPDIARALGVAYVLDGSVRKSGGRVRIAARLVRAENGYVIWAQAYERPLGDILMVQDDIASEVTKALRASFAPESGGAGPK